MPNPTDDTLKNFPEVPTQLEPNLRRFLTTLVSACRLRFGLTVHSSVDRAITEREYQAKITELERRISALEP